MRWSVVWLALVACKGGNGTEPPTVRVDNDADGFAAGEDCNDADNTVFPGAPERCDGIDNDCDGDASDMGASHIENGEAGATLADTVALSAPGDTVIVCPGTHGAVSIDGITLSGSDEGVIIDADGVGSAVVASGEVTLTNLTLTGGIGSQAGDSTNSGGGLNAWEATDVTLLDVEISGNTGAFGGGLVVGTADVILEGVTVSDNTAENGGGMHLQGGTVSCAGTVFSSNVAEAGGGMRVQDGVVDGCSVTSNVAEDGAGVFVVGTSTLQDVTSESNTASHYAGGMYLVGDAVVDLIGVELIGNTATELGGGAFINPGTVVTTTAFRVVDNVAQGDGGGIYIRGSSIVGQAEIIGNEATGFGGGIATFEGAILEGLSIEENMAETGAGMTLRGQVDLSLVVLERNVASAFGGGAYGQDASVTASAVLLVDNVAHERGGGLYLRETEVTGTDVEIVGNTADTAGGVYASSTGFSALTGVNIAQNDATTGGGVLALGTLVLAGTVTENTAERGAGVYVEGEIAVTVDGEVSENVATGFGGGLYPHQGATLTFTGLLDGNVAERGAGANIGGGSTLVLSGSVTNNGDLGTVSGGGIRVTEGTLEVTDTTFVSNAPEDVYTVGDTMAHSFGAFASFVCTEAGC